MKRCIRDSYNAALLAAEEYKETHPEARVFVLDSLSAGPELRLLAERLRDLVRIGMEMCIRDRSSC